MFFLYGPILLVYIENIHRRFSENHIYLNKLRYKNQNHFRVLWQDKKFAELNTPMSFQMWYVHYYGQLANLTIISDDGDWTCRI